MLWDIVVIFLFIVGMLALGGGVLLSLAKERDPKKRSFQALISFVRYPFSKDNRRVSFADAPTTKTTLATLMQSESETGSAYIVPEEIPGFETLEATATRLGEVTQKFESIRPKGTNHSTRRSATRAARVPSVLPAEHRRLP